MKKILVLGIISFFIALILVFIAQSLLGMIIPIDEFGISRMLNKNVGDQLKDTTTLPEAKNAISSVQSNTLNAINILETGYFIGLILVIWVPVFGLLYNIFGADDYNFV